MHNGYIVCFEGARLMCWGLDQRPPVPDNIFKLIFLYEIALLFKLKLHWYFARNSSVNDMASLVRTTAWHPSGAKTLRERMVASFSDDWNILDVLIYCWQVCTTRNLNVGHMWIPRWTDPVIFHAFWCPGGGVVSVDGIFTCIQRWHLLLWR